MNVLLITSEDNGVQLGCYGEGAVGTPNLDRLAAQGARFENAYVTQAVCSPSRSSILTGLYPHQNGQIGLATHAYRMHRAFETMPGLLKAAGYRTGRIGKLHVNPESAFPFDFVWKDPAHPIDFYHRDVARVAKAAGQFMEGGGPFFLMVNYPDAHLPWLRQANGLPAEPVLPGKVKVPVGVGVNSGRLREHAANYFNCMGRLDSGIGMLLGELERSGHAEDTVVIYMADHGPQFSRGKCCVYELGVRVPMIVRWPGKGKAGVVRGELVSGIDILPTVLEAAGVEALAGLPGRSLGALVGGEGAAWRERVFCEWNTSHPHPWPSLMYPQRSVRDGRYKLIETLLPERDNPVEYYYTQRVRIDSGTSQWEIDEAPEEVRRAYSAWRRPGAVELYDLEADPHEFVNIAEREEMAGVKAGLLGALRQWQRETGDPLADKGKLRMLMEVDGRVSAEAGSHKREGFEWGYVGYLYE